jgi:ubiquinone/menaquinone biosynthesis C-methylase UbiE
VSAALDPFGAQLLDPGRDQFLRPDELVKRFCLRENAVVADIGAGPGYLTLPLARAVPRGKVIATDVRGDYLEIAGARARDAGLSNVDLRVVPRNHPALDDCSVDLAVLCQMDRFVGDRVSYFDALAVALRSGGRIALINDIGRRNVVLDAVAATALRIVDEWQPSPLDFVLLLAHGGS